MRYLGLDLGRATIGLALADDVLRTARALRTLQRRDDQADLASLRQVVAEYEVGRLVLGLPLNMDGSEGPSAHVLPAPARLGAGRIAPFREVPWVVSAGEKLPAAMIDQWRAATGREILSLYGMSETFCVCMISPPGTSNGERTGSPFEGIGARRLTAEGREAAAQ